MYVKYLKNINYEEREVIFMNNELGYVSRIWLRL